MPCERELFRSHNTRLARPDRGGAEKRRSQLSANFTIYPPLRLIPADVNWISERIRPMQRDYAYRKLQGLLLQELQDKQLVATQGAVEDFLRLAAAKGFDLDDLIRMVESGMSGQQKAETVAALSPHES